MKIPETLEIHFLGYQQHLQKLGKYADAEKLGIKALHIMNRPLEREHPDTMLATGNPAHADHSPEKFSDVQKLQIKQLDQKIKRLRSILEFLSVSLFLYEYFVFETRELASLWGTRPP